MKIDMKIDKKIDMKLIKKIVISREKENILCTWSANESWPLQFVFGQ